MELQWKYEKLKDYLFSFGRVAVAFSGGVDSTFLLYAAKEALGENAFAITAASFSFPKRELKESEEFCKKLGVNHIILPENELEIEGYANNPKDRCYLCKKDFFSKIIAKAQENAISAVVEGSNLDDNGDYRPGLRAIAELNVISPLREVGFTKSEIREMSKRLDLPTWDKPSFACLASRIPYGETITKEKLLMIDSAEQLLLEKGFKQFRVRVHDNLARIELLPEDFDAFMQKDVRLFIDKEFKRMGFAYVSLDLLGYRTGSLNEVL